MATATEQSPQIFRQIDQLRAVLDGQILVSQNRWVDHCLDLYNQLDQLSLRQVVKRILAEICHLCSVDARWLSAQLALLATAVEIESAFDQLAIPTH